MSKGKPPAVPVTNHRQRHWVADQLPEGVTYRQLDYWARQGYVVLPARGPGYSRQLDDTELWVAEWMGRLIKAGLQARAAARVARALVEDPNEVEAWLAPGIWISVPGRLDDVDDVSAGAG